jgi:hypothetical protein
MSLSLKKTPALTLRKLYQTFVEVRIARNWPKAHAIKYWVADTLAVVSREKRNVCRASMKSVPRLILSSMGLMVTSTVQCAMLRPYLLLPVSEVPVVTYSTSSVSRKDSKSSG